jgi:hypothetical protein
MNFEPNKAMSTEVEYSDTLDRAVALGFVSERAASRARAIGRHLGPMIAGGLLCGGSGAVVTEVVTPPTYPEVVYQHVVPGPEQSTDKILPRILEHPEPTPPSQTHDVVLRIR